MSCKAFWIVIVTCVGRFATRAGAFSFGKGSVTPTAGRTRSTRRPALDSRHGRRNRRSCMDRPKHHCRNALLMSYASYGRGAEIWPESSNERILLKDSFPGGVLPKEILFQDDELLQELSETEEENDDDDDDDDDDALGVDVKDSTTTTTTTITRRRRKRRLLPRAIEKILTRAAMQQEEELEHSNSDVGIIDKTPALIALALLRLVQPIDVLVVAFLSGYTAILTVAAQTIQTSSSLTTTTRTRTPLLPSLPPQGHVPALVSNPLGNAFTNSDGYQLWLGIGFVVSLVAPIVWMALSFLLLPTATPTAASMRLCARPVFLLCCQAVTESLARRVMAPLPIRILVPIAYNAVRLGPLWNWALTAAAAAPAAASSSSLLSLGSVMMLFGQRLLAFLNLAYWLCNLFGFLLPIASIKYMRAYFFNVEAEQVTIRKGMERTIGLS